MVSVVLFSEFVGGFFVDVVCVCVLLVRFAAVSPDLIPGLLLSIEHVSLLSFDVLWAAQDSNL